MKKFDICVGISAYYNTTIEAETLKEAMDKALAKAEKLQDGIPVVLTDNWIASVNDDPDWEDNENLK